MPERFVDLQTHSTCSDGTLTPAEIAREAHRAGLAAVALTDHDTVVGQAEIIATGAELGLEVIPAVEVSVVTPFQGVDLLAYFIDHHQRAFRAALDEVRAYRDVRTPMILEKLATLGMDITMDDVRAEAGGDVLGRPHIASAIVRKRYAQTTQEVFDKYLKSGGPAYVPKERLDALKAIEIIHNAGGLAVLAHPCYVKPERFHPVLDGLAEGGLDGLEVWYSEHDLEARRIFKATADKMGLVATGGSDFHGANKPHIRIGVGKGDLRVPYSAVQAMKERLGKNR